jgi:hypothetical protein
MNIDIDDLVTRYVAVWNEPDPSARRAMIASLWAADATEYTEESEYHGHAAMESRVTEAHTDLVQKGGFLFHPEFDTRTHHGAIAFTTKMTPASGGDPAWRGRVFLVLADDGRIRDDYQFAL